MDVRPAFHSPENEWYSALVKVQISLFPIKHRLDFFDWAKAFPHLEACSPAREEWWCPVSSLKLPIVGQIRRSHAGRISSLTVSNNSSIRHPTKGKFEDITTYTHRPLKSLKTRPRLQCWYPYVNLLYIKVRRQTIVMYNHLWLRSYLVCGIGWRFGAPCWDGWTIWRTELKSIRV